MLKEISDLGVPLSRSQQNKILGGIRVLPAVTKRDPRESTNEECTEESSSEDCN